MFERFTLSARQVVALASDEARALKHGEVGTEHILLGLLREEQGVAAHVLESFGMSTELVRARLLQIVASREEAASDEPKLTPRAMKVLDLALREALSLGHNYIGTEHILLGLVRDNGGVAVRIMLDFNADSQAVRDEVIRRLSDTGVARKKQAAATQAKLVSGVVDHLIIINRAEAEQWLAIAGLGALPPAWDQLPRALRRARLADIVGKGKPSALARLREVLDSYAQEIQRDKAKGKAVLESGDASMPDVDTSGPIFVVHGHDQALLDRTVRVLEKATRREVIVLHEQPNSGRTILEKFEEHAASASFAVVLLTADDEGGSAALTERQPRGRQNVIFELGFFFGRLGRKRVVVLLASGVEKPSDIDGLVYIAVDSGGAWRHSVLKELASLGIAVDYSKVP